MNYVGGKIKTQIKAVDKTVAFAWRMRLSFRAEGGKLYAKGAKLYSKGDKLCAEGGKFYAEGNKLRAEGAKLYADGDKLCAEGDKLYANAVLEVLGNVALKWTWIAEKRDSSCELPDGTVLIP